MTEVKFTQNNQSSDDFLKQRNESKKQQNKATQQMNEWLMYLESMTKSFERAELEYKKEAAELEATALKIVDMYEYNLPKDTVDELNKLTKKLNKVK